MSPTILLSFGIVMVTAIIIWWMMERVSDRIQDRAFDHPAWDKRPFFSPSRVGKLLGAFFVVGILGSIPFAVIQLWVASHEADKAVDTKQEKLNRSMNDIREAVRQGKAGKAFQQLYPQEHEEYLRKKKAAERASAGKLDSLLDREFVIEGVATDAKAGAMVVGPDFAVYVLVDESWPAEALGKKVRATGILRKKKLIPDPVVDPKGAVSAGAVGEQYVLEKARWEIRQ